MMEESRRNRSKSRSLRVSKRRHRENFRDDDISRRQRREHHHRYDKLEPDVEKESRKREKISNQSYERQKHYEKPDYNQKYNRNYEIPTHYFPSKRLSKRSSDEDDAWDKAKQSRYDVNKYPTYYEKSSVSDTRLYYRRSSSSLYQTEYEYQRAFYERNRYSSSYSYSKYNASKYDKEKFPVNPYHYDEKLFYKQSYYSNGSTSKYSPRKREQSSFEDRGYKRRMPLNDWSPRSKSRSSDNRRNAYYY